MCQNTVDQFSRLDLRKSLDRIDALLHLGSPDHNVSQQLSLIGIVILWKRGKFIQFSDIMENSRS